MSRNYIGRSLLLRTMIPELVRRRQRYSATWHMATPTWEAGKDHARTEKNQLWAHPTSRLLLYEPYISKRDVREYSSEHATHRASMLCNPFIARLQKQTTSYAPQSVSCLHLQGPKLGHQREAALLRWANVSALEQTWPACYVARRIVQTPQCEGTVLCTRTALMSVAHTNRGLCVDDTLRRRLAVNQGRKYS